MRSLGHLRWKVCSSDPGRLVAKVKSLLLPPDSMGKRLGIQKEERDYGGTSVVADEVQFPRSHEGPPYCITRRRLEDANLVARLKTSRPRSTCDPRFAPNRPVNLYRGRRAPPIWRVSVEFFAFLRCRKAGSDRVHCSKPRYTTYVWR